MRTTIPLAITFLTGTLIVIEFLFKIPFLTGVSSSALSWGITVSAFASALGAANLLRINSQRVQARREKWWLGALLIAVMLGTVVLGLAVKPSGDLYRFFWNNMLQPLSATLFSANAFYITSAAYRVFRIRNLEAAVLMTAALLVMLGNIGVGRALWSQFPVIGGWIMRVPNAAGMRGIVIGAALGAISISLRVILGFERSHFGMSE